MPTPPADPQTELVEAFWTEARVRSGLAGEEIYQGVSSSAVLRPPAWSFGDTREMADELCALVLSGRKTMTSSPAWAYDADDGDGDGDGDGEPMPEAGSVTILCDGSGSPRALLRTTRVRVVPFDEVEAAHAWAEGEGDGSLDGWRAGHQDFFTRVDDGSHPFAADMPVVLEEFEVLARA